VRRVLLEESENLAVDGIHGLVPYRHINALVPQPVELFRCDAAFFQLYLGNYSIARGMVRPGRSRGCDNRSVPLLAAARRHIL
jgi:hypothetical protein